MPFFENRKILQSKISTFAITSAGFMAIRQQFFNQNQVVKETAPGISRLGMPVWESVFFEGGKYDPLDGGPAINYGGGVGSIIRLDTALLTINQSKNIVTTPLQGRSGTVKEYIADGDYVINLSGRLISEDNQYPEEEIETLISLLNAPAAIVMVTKMLRLLNIDKVVITDYSIPRDVGQQNEQIFSINMLSDNEIILE